MVDAMAPKAASRERYMSQPTMKPARIPNAVLA
jgi:hypothetical protein